MTAWREGNIHRKREPKNAIFPEGLNYWVKNRVFKPRKCLSAEEFCALVDEISLIGVPDGI